MKVIMLKDLRMAIIHTFESCARACKDAHMEKRDWRLLYSAIDVCRSDTITGERHIMNNPFNAGTLPSVEGIVSRPSPFSVEETLERLKAALHNRNLSLFAQIDHSEEAKRVGLTMQEAHVLIFGSPKAGTPLMIASPLLALDLPLRILVWQSEDNLVWVSNTSSTYLQARYAIPQELIGNISGIDDLIEHVLHI
jgi:uncharacterized protein (DUF302 family)